MSFGNDYAYDFGAERSQSAVASERATFIRRTYAHLAVAILAFVAIEAGLLAIPNIERYVFTVFAGSALNMLLIFGVFIGVSYLAQMWAMSSTSRGVQYAGLSIYVLLEAAIILPLLVVAAKFSGDSTIIPTAGILTLAIFGGLTGIVFVTKKDFSFLASILMVGSFIALGVIICAVIFGFSLGMFFTIAMIVLMVGYILYDTSNVLHHYRTDQYVAASLALFASIATLFYYILRLLLILSNRN
jgi:FtsH-binding integral membrane protein